MTYFRIVTPEEHTIMVVEEARQQKTALWVNTEKQSAILSTIPCLNHTLVVSYIPLH